MTERKAAISLRVARNEEEFTAFAVTGMNVVGGSFIAASLEGIPFHPDGSPRIALGLAPFDVTTGPEKTPKRNRHLYMQDFALQYLVFDRRMCCTTAQACVDSLADIAAVWFMSTGGFEEPLTAVPLDGVMTNTIRYSDLIELPREEGLLALEVPSVVRLLTYGCFTATKWDRDRLNCWQVLLNSRRLRAAAHFLRTSMNSYWRDFSDWEDCQRWGDPEPQVAPGPGDAAHQGAFKCIEEIFGGSLPDDPRRARQKVCAKLLRDYAIDPGTLWTRMDTGEACNIVDAILHLQGDRDRRSHGGSAYRLPLREAEILDAQYLARFLLVLCSKHEPAHR